MYLDPDPSERFLVADEVGLGKTHVAKGVVAQVLSHLADLGDDRHDIVYIWSDSAIASQNIRELVPLRITARDKVDGRRRLTVTALRRD